MDFAAAGDDRVGDLARPRLRDRRILAALGVVLSLLFTGSAMATTAIGTLIPILSDANETRTRFGTYLLAAGAVGEFGPILLITLFFSTGNPLSSALLLLAFVAIAVFAAVFAVRGVGAGWDAFERNLEKSSQLPIRLAVVLIFALATLATDLGLDLLLGGFVAGIIARLALGGREVEILESKLSAVGYGFLIPFFFVVSGVEFELDACSTTRPSCSSCRLPGRVLMCWGPGGAPLPQGPRRPRPKCARILQRHRAAARRRDHDDRDRQR